MEKRISYLEVNGVFDEPGRFDHEISIDVGSNGEIFDRGTSFPIKWDELESLLSSMVPENPEEHSPFILMTVGEGTRNVVECRVFNKAVARVGDIVKRINSTKKHSNLKLFVSVSGLA